MKSLTSRLNKYFDINNVNKNNENIVNNEQLDYMNFKIISF